MQRLYCFSEQAIALAILRLVEQEKAVIEGAGAVGVAAILEDKLPELKGKRFSDSRIFSNSITTYFLYYM